MAVTPLKVLLPLGREGSGTEPAAEAAMSAPSRRGDIAATANGSPGRLGLGVPVSLMVGGGALRPPGGSSEASSAASIRLTTLTGSVG